MILQKLENKIAKLYVEQTKYEINKARTEKNLLKMDKLAREIQALRLEIIKNATSIKEIEHVL